MEMRRRNIEYLMMRKAERMEKKRKNKKKVVLKVKNEVHDATSPTFDEKDISTRLNSSFHGSPYLTGHNSKYLKAVIYSKQTVSFNSYKNRGYQEGYGNSDYYSRLGKKSPLLNSNEIKYYSKGYFESSRGSIKHKEEPEYKGVTDETNSNLKTSNIENYKAIGDSDYRDSPNKISKNCLPKLPATGKVLPDYNPYLQNPLLFMSPLQKRKRKSIVEKKERDQTPQPNYSKVHLYNSPYMIPKLA